MSAAAPTLAQVQQMAHELSLARRTPVGTPVPWSARPVTRFGKVQAPAYGAANQVTLLTYQVPVNWTALIYGIVLQFVGAPPAPLPGDLIFTVDIDRPLLNTTLGYTEKDYGAVPFPLGSLTTGPYWPVEWKHATGETIRVKGQTVLNVSFGPGTFFEAALLGWEWPAEGWE